jgi:hypothetical protein
MIKRKICNHEGCDNPRWARGFCKFHDTKVPIVKEKKAYSIPKFSEKKKQELVKYKRVRDKFMTGKVCAVCGKDATDLHHMKGRIGELLVDVTCFLAVCRPCHQKIEDNPAWAKENGYSFDRLTT